MPRLLQILAAATVLTGSTAPVFAIPSGDDNKESVEARLLKILKDRGVLNSNEYEELVKVGAQMRAEETITSAAIEREISELAERVARQGDAKKSTAPETKVSYKHGKGLIVTQGEDFSMTVGGREQIRFSYISPDGKTAAGQDDRASFDVRRARIWMEGFALTKDLEYKLQIDLAPTAGTPLRDAYLDYRFAKELHIRAGQMKRPFSRQNWTSSGDLQFPDRISVVERFRSLAGDRDNGAIVWGEFGDNKEVEWYAGVFNGEGLNNGTPNAVNIGQASAGLGLANSSNNDSSGLETVARLVFNPMGSPGYSEGDLDLTDTPKMGIGMQYSFNPERRGNPLGIGGIPGTVLPTYDVHTFGADFVLKYHGLFITAEGYHRVISPEDRLDTAGIFNTSTEDGWFAQAGYFFGTEKGKGPELAVRYGQIDFDQNIAPASAFGGSTLVDDLTAAFNYYFAGHNAKLQIAYTYRTDNLRRIDANNEHQVLQIQAQVKF